MPNEVISYREMCDREGVSLQRGMNFHLKGHYSVILMSVRRGAPYADVVVDNGTTIIYEGHDVPKSSECPDPKKVDQVGLSPSGSFTQNGLFNNAALQFKDKKSPPERVRVYEKIKSGIWSYNGIFHLSDSVGSIRKPSQSL